MGFFKKKNRCQKVLTDRGQSGICKREASNAFSTTDYNGRPMTVYFCDRHSAGCGLDAISDEDAKK